MNAIKLTISLKSEKLKVIFEENNVPFTEENAEKFFCKWREPMENILERDVYNLIKGDESSVCLFRKAGIK